MIHTGVMGVFGALLLAACSHGAPRGDETRAGAQRAPDAGDAASPASGPGSAERARAVLDQAFHAHGGVAAVRAMAGRGWVGTGRRDLAAQFQGHAYHTPQWVPYEERLLISRRGELAFETHGKVNADADEWLRYVFDAKGRQLIVDRINARAFWVPSADDQADRLRRSVPVLLLDELITRRAALQTIERTNERITLSASLDGVEPFTLLVDATDHRLHGIEYALDAPMLGHTQVRWSWDQYRHDPHAGLVPGRSSIHVGDRIVQTVSLSLIDAPADLLDGLDGIDVPQPPAPVDTPTAVEPRATAMPPASVRDLGDGLHLVPNVRGGFHAMVIELEQSLVVVDAPAGYHELRMLPALDWADAPESSAVGQRLLDAARSVAPGKRVSHLIATHHHGDHIGGALPFIAAGARIVASAETAHAIRDLVAANADQMQPDLQIVDARLRIGEGERVIEVIDVGTNPHAEGMLVVWMPWASALYQSDLFFPSGAHFPDRSRLPVMQWFADWLDSARLAPTTVYSIHGSARATPEQFEQLRDQ